MQPIVALGQVASDSALGLLRQLGHDRHGHIDHTLDALVATAERRRGDSVLWRSKA